MLKGDKEWSQFKLFWQKTCFILFKGSDSYNKSDAILKLYIYAKPYSASLS